MASVFRFTLGRFVANRGTQSLLGNGNIQFVRTITSKLEDLPPKPKPYPYQEKSYTLLNYPFDKTTARLDENSKIIVIEGPVAAGKTNFAKEVACAFNMLYLPEANLDMMYINSYGFDLKKLDPQLPELCRSFDVMDFLRNPKHKLTARMQIEQYIVKLSQYVDALAHVLSTGQGVVLDRCVYSDFVFTEAMYSQGYISKGAYKKYYEFRDCTIGELLRPHLVIYLDVPVPKVIDNIKKRAISYEKDSSVLTPKYLELMERHYKQSYLRDISKHADLLVYDWSEQGDIEVVIEDIERIDFNRFDEQDTQLKDWVYRLEEEWACLRYLYSDNKQSVMAYTNIPCFEVPELLLEPLDAEAYRQIMAEAPGERYEVGYNAALGDSGLLFKSKVPHRDTLPLIERRSV